MKGTMDHPNKSDILQSFKLVMHLVICFNDINKTLYVH